jgi:hypothetical protein
MNIDNYTLGNVFLWKVKAQNDYSTENKLSIDLVQMTIYEISHSMSDYYPVYTFVVSVSSSPIMISKVRGYRITPNGGIITQTFFIEALYDEGGISRAGQSGITVLTPHAGYNPMSIDGIFDRWSSPVIVWNAITVGTQLFSVHTIPTTNNSLLTNQVSYFEIEYDTLQSCPGLIILNNGFKVYEDLQDNLNFTTIKTYHLLSIQ